jgi:hypothetical protein
MGVEPRPWISVPPTRVFLSWANPVTAISAVSSKTAMLDRGFITFSVSMSREFCLPDWSANIAVSITHLAYTQM